jgi:hypothetical protein
MDPIETTSVEITHGEPSIDTSTRDLVMAWAVDRDTRRPRYIGQIDKDHGGGKCNCNCPSCNLELIAVNAGKLVWEIRPHFRHPPGAAREKCIIVAARKALEEMFTSQQQVVLPRRSRSGSVEGLSGKYFTAWVHHPAEPVGIVGCSFEDETRAILTLDDGRRLTVGLLGRGQVSRNGDDATLMAAIEIRVDDPAIAMMAPEDMPPLQDGRD